MIEEEYLFIYFFFNYFCCPRRCTYTILEGFYYIYTVYMYSITQHLTVFMVSCHENKVWFWVLFNIPPLPEALETATFGILSISVPVSWYSLTQVRYLPSATPPSQWVRILSIHYVQQSRVNVGIFSPCGNRTPTPLDLPPRSLDYRRLPYIGLPAPNLYIA